MDPAQRPGAHQPPARQHRRGRRGAAAALRAVPAREVVPDLARAARMSSSGHRSSAEAEGEAKCIWAAICFAGAAG